MRLHTIQKMGQHMRPLAAQNHALFRYNARFFSVDIMKLEMPALSPTMSEGTIAKWCKAEGEKVDIGDVICEITTDKATVGYESQEEGYIGKIIYGEGSVVTIGGLIGVMVEEEEDISKVDLSQI